MTLINTLSIIVSRACDSKVEVYHGAKHNHSAVNLSNLFNKINFLIFPVLLVLFVFDAQYSAGNDYTDITKHNGIKFSVEWFLDGFSITLNSIGIMLAGWLWMITFKITETNEWMVKKHRDKVTTSKSLVAQLIMVSLLSFYVLFWIVFYGDFYVRHVRNIVIFVGLFVQTAGLFYSHKISKWHQHFAKNIRSSVTVDKKNKLIDSKNSLSQARPILLILCILNVYNFLYEFIFMFTEFQNIWNPSNTKSNANLVAFGLSFSIQNWIFLSIALCLDFIEKYDTYEVVFKNTDFSSSPQNINNAQPNNGSINDLKDKRQHKQKSRKKRKNKRSMTPSDIMLRNSVSNVDDDDSKQATL